MRLMLTIAMMAFGYAGVSRADDDAKVKEIIEKAILAQSGANETQGKLRKIKSAAIGTMKTAEGEVKGTREINIEWPNKPERFELKVKLEVGTTKIDTSLTLKGLNEGTQSIGQNSNALSIEEVNWLARDVYALWLTSLLPLKESKLNLSLSPEIKFEGKTLEGIKVQSRGKPNVELYFDSKTHLLTKVQYLGFDAGVEMKKEIIYKDHKAFDKIMMPGKEIEYYDGRKKYEWNNTNFEFPSK